jgi:signal transduction histidine kinase
MSSSVLRSRISAGFALRLNLWFAAVVTCVSLIVFLVAYYLLSTAIRLKDRHVIEGQLEVYRTWYEQGGLEGLQARFAGQADSGRDTFFVRVSGPQNTSLFVSFPRQDARLDLTQLDAIDTTEPVDWLKLPATNSTIPWLIASTRLSDGQWLQVGKTTEAQAALLEHFRVIFATALLLAVTLGVTAGLLLTARALRPIRQLIVAFQRVVDTGKMEEHIAPPSGDDELNELTRLFNRMLEKNAALIRGMREALDNVAHDLRTPLTRMRNTAERALQGADDLNAYREALSDSLEESERIGVMLNTLMDISEAETGIMKLDQRPIKLAELARTVVGLYELVAEDKQIKVTVSVAESIVCVADPGRLQQVLVNLMDNAIKYTPRSGSVDIGAEEHATDVTIIVRDTGIGMAAEEIPHIWERLYRGDKSRAERGLGLGLSLVKAIVQAHGGRMEVDSRLGQGSTFRVTFPKPPLSSSHPRSPSMVPDGPLPLIR